MSELASVQTLLAAYRALPSHQAMEGLIEDGKAAEGRGYFTPVEDERLREIYTRYLAIRVSLWEIIQDLRPGSKRAQASIETATHQDLHDFSIAFCAAEIIVGTGEYLIDLARDRDIIWKKLDEADLRYGLKRKQFTRLYRQLTSAMKMHGFYRARDFYDQNQARILEAAPSEIVKILKRLNLPTASRGDHLRRYRRFVRHSLKRRRKSAERNIVFTVFEMMGSEIAELKIPLIKLPKAPKRVTQNIRDEIRSKLMPGDVFVTRHDDAVSNLFLPGFWPHAALWLGADDFDILEAKKDGVLLRHIEETLEVDAFVVLRPKLADVLVSEALERARTHSGKLYDFIFDFSTSDRLVCTEVVYRGFHGIGEIDFTLEDVAGRFCLPAESLINQSISQGWMDVVAIYGVEGNELKFGDAAKSVLRNSFASTF